MAGSRADRITYTLTACMRCQQKKSRCDPGLPRCESCQRVDTRCVYWDASRGYPVARTYILELRARVRCLREELAHALADATAYAHDGDDNGDDNYYYYDNDNDNDDHDHDHDEYGDDVNNNTRTHRGGHNEAELFVRAAALVPFGDDAQFLGPSSGVSLARFVIEMARQNTPTKSVQDVVGARVATHVRLSASRESQKPTSKIFPLVSSVAEPSLPPKELTWTLVDMYMGRGCPSTTPFSLRAGSTRPPFLPSQYFIILHEPSFRRGVPSALDGNADPCINFHLRLVIAISLQKLDAKYAGLADSYYLSALPFLPVCIRHIDICTIQCLALIAQYSLLTPTRTAAYWVVGLAVKLCGHLGMTREATIAVPDCLETEMRRRLFWVIVSMESALSHALGRPDSFGTAPDRIDVQFFHLVDDNYITPRGILPGARQTMRKSAAVHLLKMRLIQAEIRRMLYLCKRDRPRDHTDPWFEYMLSRLNRWFATCPQTDRGTGLGESWFTGRRNAIIIFMYSPSVQISEPSIEAAHKCFEAAAYNIHLYSRQVEACAVDTTWAFVSSVCLVLNTILWSLSYPAIRRAHPLDEVALLTRLALTVISSVADRWPGAEPMLSLYDSLVARCLAAYQSEGSFVVPSVRGSAPTPAFRSSPRSASNIRTPNTASAFSANTALSSSLLRSQSGTSFGENLTRSSSSALSPIAGFGQPGATGQTQRSPYVNADLTRETFASPQRVNQQAHVLAEPTSPETVPNLGRAPDYKTALRGINTQMEAPVLSMPESTPLGAAVRVGLSSTSVSYHGGDSYGHHLRSTPSGYLDIHHSSAPLVSRITVTAPPLCLDSTARVIDPNSPFNPLPQSIPLSLFQGLNQQDQTPGGMNTSTQLMYPLDDTEKSVFNFGTVSHSPDNHYYGRSATTMAFMSPPTAATAAATTTDLASTAPPTYNTAPVVPLDNVNSSGIMEYLDSQKLGYEDNSALLSALAKNPPQLEVRKDEAEAKYESTLSW